MFGQPGMLLWHGLRLPFIAATALGPGARNVEDLPVSCTLESELLDFIEAPGKEMLEIYLCPTFSMHFTTHVSWILFGYKPITLNISVTKCREHHSITISIAKPSHSIPYSD